MAVNSVFAEHEPVRDVPVTEPFGYQTEHLQLACAQGLAMVGLCPRRAHAEGLEEGPRPCAAGPRANLFQALQGCARLTLRGVCASEGEQRRGELQPGACDL